MNSLTEILSAVKILGGKNKEGEKKQNKRGKVNR